MGKSSSAPGADQPSGKSGSSGGKSGSSGKRGKRSAVSVGVRGSAPSDNQRVHYWSSAHSCHRCLVHLVFCPKYRHRVLEGPIAARLVELFEQCCLVNRWYIHELAVQPDHLHLLVQVSPSDCVSDVVRRLKGGSSRVLRLEFEALEEFLWGDSFWSDGYFCEFVGHRDESAVAYYIRHQGKAQGRS